MGHTKGCILSYHVEMQTGTFAFHSVSVVLARVKLQISGNAVAEHVRMEMFCLYPINCDTPTLKFSTNRGTPM